MAVASTEAVAGRYRLIRRLGTGGAAAVYLAEDMRLGRRVAIKRLHAESPAELARRFEREARLGASLNHPNVVSVYDILAEPEGVSIVMEHVDGETLADAIAGGRIDRATAVDVIRGLGDALDHAHAHGVVHRDVKPANVLLGRSGEVKLVDLGIATATEGTRVTSAGTVLGTPAYMSPEQLEGGSPGPAADVYSFATVAFEALSGRRAREGATPIEIARRAVTEPPPDLREAWPGAPPAAARALARGMDPEPSRRPKSAGELARAVCDAIEAPEAGGGGSTEAFAPPAPRPAAPAVRGRAVPVIGAAAAVLAAGGIAMAIAFGGGEEGDRPEGGKGGDRRAARAERPPRSAAPAEAPGAPAARAEESGAASPSGGDDPALGTSLNDRGKALIDAGRPDEAVPVLERAVAAFPEGTTDINYAYALFNLGNALRLSGRPDEAMPVLERRLEFEDQRATVLEELELARAEAGEAQTPADGPED